MRRVDGVAYWFPNAPHRVSKVIAEAFAKGGRAYGDDWFASDTPEPMSKSKMLAPNGTNRPIGHRSAFYGILHGGGSIAKAGAGDFYYIDHGYWGKSPSLATLTGNFRIVRNALQHGCVTKNKSLGRFDSSGMVLEPVRSWSTYYLVALPPTEHQVNFYGEGIRKEFDEKLREMSDNFENVHISRKGDKISLTEHLKHASFALGFNSTGLFEAARLGIPVITTGPSPLSELHDCFDAKEWEEKRLAIFRGCADRQFTLAEIANGTAYRTLAAIGEL